ncbi:MAG TPA: class I SAM-dependent methyltransferase [Rhodopila sp.]
MTDSHDVQDNSAQIEYWNDKAAITWTAFQERLDALFQPLTALALDAAAPAVGERAIDVGCGCGATVLALADRVGPTGEVLGLDVSQPMATRARERIAAAGLPNARVTIGDAASFTFSEGRADLLFSRFGVMFFSDPVAAFGNLRTAVRQDGRLLCAAWRPMADNSWFRIPLEAARSLLPPQPPADPDAPGPFAFANPDRTRTILSDAGWRNVTLTRADVPMYLAAAGQLDQAVDFATHVGVLARLLADQDRETRARVREAVGQALKSCDSPAGITLSGSIWLISAKA